jgi:ABC-type proline/glycine betaine transport system permease subunit
VSLLKSYQLRYCTYVGMELCANADIKCPKLVCLEQVLICVYFNVMLEFPIQIYAAFSNVVQKMCIGTEC